MVNCTGLTGNCFEFDLSFVMEACTTPCFFRFKEKDFRVASEASDILLTGNEQQHMVDKTGKLANPRPRKSSQSNNETVSNSIRLKGPFNVELSPRCK